MQIPRGSMKKNQGINLGVSSWKLNLFFGALEIRNYSFRTKKELLLET
jgi:hypothetical protein